MGGVLRCESRESGSGPSVEQCADRRDDENRQPLGNLLPVNRDLGIRAEASDDMQRGLLPLVANAWIGTSIQQANHRFGVRPQRLQTTTRGLMIRRAFSIDNGATTAKRRAIATSHFRCTAHARRGECANCDS